MVTAAAPQPNDDHQQQQQQAKKKKKFKLKNLFRKNKYAEFQNKLQDDCPDNNNVDNSGRSIEVLDFQEQGPASAAAAAVECSQETERTQDPDTGPQTDASWAEEGSTSTRSRKRVRFWRYSKDEALLEDEDLEECGHRDQEATEQGTETERQKKKKKKSKKKRAKEAGLRTWKYCKTGWKYMKEGLVLYANGAASINITNVAGVFRPPYQQESTFTDYAQYDKYDQYGNKKRRQEPRTDYTQYDAYCKTRRH